MKLRGLLYCRFSYLLPALTLLFILIMLLWDALIPDALYLAAECTWDLFMLLVIAALFSFACIFSWLPSFSLV